MPALAVFSGALAFLRMWRRDRPWTGFAYTSGLLSISLVVAIAVYVALWFGVGLIVAARWSSV